jgi:hypothetical protein
MSISDELRPTPVIDRLNAAVRENPLAAGLIGAGIVWMIFGGGKGFGKVAGIVSASGDKLGSAIADAGAGLASGVTQAATSAREAASDIMSSSASIVPDASLPDSGKAFEAVSHAGSAIGDGMNTGAAAGREYGSVIQSQLSESLQQQPLLLGAIGLAIGVGIASTFATTKVERELMGEQGSAARETLQNLTDGVTERATQVISEAKNEAERQGFTAAGAKKALKSVADKGKTVAGAARDSVTGQLSD